MAMRWRTPTKRKSLEGWLNSAVKNQPQCVEQESPTQDMHVRAGLSFFFDKPRQCQHDRHAGDKNKKRKNQVVKAEPDPLRMVHLRAEEIAHRVERRALVAQHPVERPDRSVGADDPENAEPTQRVDRYDTASLQGKQRIYIAHWEPVTLAGIVRRKRTRTKKVSIKVRADCGIIRQQRFYKMNLS